MVLVRRLLTRAGPCMYVRSMDKRNLFYLSKASRQTLGREYLDGDLLQGIYILPPISSENFLQLERVKGDCILSFIQVKHKSLN